MAWLLVVVLVAMVIGASLMRSVNRQAALLRRHVEAEQEISAVKRQTIFAMFDAARQAGYQPAAQRHSAYEDVIESEAWDA